MGVACAKPTADSFFTKSYISDVTDDECSICQLGRQKILFLDVDGVLHPVNGQQEFVDPCVHQLCRIVKATNASIVLSTAWRLVPVAKAFLEAQMTVWGLEQPIGETPELRKPSDNIFLRYCGGVKGSMRPGEIMAWLNTNMEMVDVPRWVAIDDIDMTAELDPHMVKTDKRVGLTQEDADRAIWTLNSDEPCHCQLCTSMQMAQAELF